MLHRRRLLAAPFGLGVSLRDRAVGCAETPALPGFPPSGVHPFCNPICEVKAPIRCPVIR